jgi:hypothetical protein
MGYWFLGRKGRERTRRKGGCWEGDEKGRGGERGGGNGGGGTGGTGAGVEETSKPTGLFHFARF